MEIENLRDNIKKGQIVVLNKTQGFKFMASLTLSNRAVNIILDGGLLNYVKKQHISSKKVE